MKRCFCVIFLILLLFSQVSGRERFLIGGLNISRFYDASSKPLPGYSVGYGAEWQVHENFRLTLALSWFCRGARAENKLVYSESWITWVNANWRVGYVQIPLSFKYYLSSRNMRSYYVRIGLSACIGLHDGSTVERIRKEKTPRGFAGHSADYVPDYEPFWDTIVGSSALDSKLGFGVRWRKFALEWQISTNLWGDVDSLGSIASINSKFITLSIAVSRYL